MTTASPPLPAIELPLSRLSPLILLGIYLIVPATLMFVLLDAVATNLEFSRRISFDPQLFLLVSLLLQTPHAIASMFTFADREYVVAYRFTLAKCILVGIGTLALILLVGDMPFMACLMAYNFYHQNSQQAGIAAMVARNKSRLHNVWRWMAIFIESMGLLAIMIRLSPNVQVLPEAKPIMILLSVLVLVAFGFVGMLVARQSKTDMGRLLIAAHTIMLFVYAGMFALDLPLLMIIAPVVVHDLTAFAFYINHNTNRNRDTKFNVLSRLRNVLPMPELLLTPLMALAVVGVILLSGSTATSYFAFVSILINVIHIYLEGRMWKAGSLHRKYTLV